MFKINKTMLLYPHHLTWPLGGCGHIPFVGWLVEELQPSKIVELGTSSGNTYFAICQSVVESHIKAHCYAIGHWDIESSAGHINQNASNALFEYNQKYYSGFSSMLSLQKQDLEAFDKQSIDLLYIDGSQDFPISEDILSNWLPKISSRGIILVQNVNKCEPESDLWHFWENMSQRYPNFYFNHSDGLGVLFIGEESHSILTEKLESTSENEIIRKLFKDLGSSISLLATEKYCHSLKKEYLFKSQDENDVFYLGREFDSNSMKNQASSQRAIMPSILSEVNDKRSREEKKLTDIQEVYERKLALLREEYKSNTVNTQKLVNQQKMLLDEKQRRLDNLLHSHSWRITRPLRFVFRLFRGQYSIALQPVKILVRGKLKEFYYMAPSRYRAKLLRLGFRLRPSWFQNHPAFLQTKTSLYSQDSSRQKLLIDLNQQSDDYEGVPGRVAVHCHIFYHDLIDEFRQQLATIPFKFDVFVSVATAEGRDVCQRVLRTVPNIGKLEVVLVPNRGRDIGPMFVQFGKKLQVYDFVGHIQSKKSLYNGGTTLGWREYLLNALFGSSANVKRIFKLFSENDRLGIIYPQTYNQLTYAAFTWLANSEDGSRLCARMGIDKPLSYFNFPTGSMFWSRTDAMRPLFDLDLRWDDFPEELGQTDGTTAHAIERMLGVVPTAMGYETLIIKDMQSSSWSPFRIDQQYLPRLRQTYFQFIEEAGIKVVAFDIFDTLLVRPLIIPDHTKKMVMAKLSGPEKTAYDEFRVVAESQARSKRGRDVGLDDIYSEFTELSGLPTDCVKNIRQLEVFVESASVSARHEVAELLPRAKKAGKRVVLISDMFIDKGTVKSMLSKNGIVEWDQLYLSSERGVRKDNAELYALMLKEEGVSGKEVLMIGDNERSDLQLPADTFDIRCFHILSAVNLARCLPSYSPYLDSKSISTDLDKELTVGLILRQNLNKIADFTKNDVDIFGNEPYKIGFNLTGPLILAFCHWLLLQAKKDNIQRFYFLSREGKIIKKVYDAWVASIPDAPKSYYLQVSRRAVNVPSIVTFEDVKVIAQSDYFMNKVENFLYERFGLELNEERWQEIYSKDLWSKGKLLEIFNKDISLLEPLLQYLLPDILYGAEVEKRALVHYLNDCDFMDGSKLAVVDVGYSGTIQKSLNRLTTNTIHGYYFATANNVRDGMLPNAITRGCYVDNAEPCFARSHVFSGNFNLEKLLSADDPQMMKYIENENGELERKFKFLREGELATRVPRHELQNGCMAFVDQAIDIRENLYKHFAPSLDIANSLYSDFILQQQELGSSVLSDLVLDDDYCGRGLIN